MDRRTFRAALLQERQAVHLPRAAPEEDLANKRDALGAVIAFYREEGFYEVVSMDMLVATSLAEGVCGHEAMK